MKSSFDSHRKIGLIVPSLMGGGGVPAVARFLKDMILRSGRYELKLVSLATSADDTCNAGIVRPASWRQGAAVSHGAWEGLPFVHIGAVAGELEFQRYRSRSALKETVADCDILQVICGSPAWAYAVCGLGKPVSVQCATRARVERRRRDASPVGLAGWWRKAMTEITDRMDDQALRAADAIQVENPWMFEYARDLNKGREVDLRYAPPGLNAKTFCPAGERTLARDPYLLCVGRLDDPRKNIGLLLEAYALIPEGVRCRLRLILAGQAGPPDSFRRRAEALGLQDRIAFIHRPSLDDLVVLYQRASVFALPSDEEGLGIALLEAMACGIPVVSTRSGGPDGIITEGEDGYLVPLDDAQALADRIARLCLDEELNRSMGQRARGTIEQRYAERVAGQAFLDVWDRLLHKPGKT
jgi:glycosyltransferase involved in cell wall biosynthesis